MLRRVVLVGGGLLVAWFTLLVILSVALTGRQERHTRERLAESLQATVTLGDLDLALVRGQMTIDALSIKRDDAIGHLAIDVDGVRCELPPLGLALLHRDCNELNVRGLRLEVSTSALFKLERPKKTRPIHADRMTIENATLVFLPSAFLPSLGRIEITIERAVSGSTVLRTPISWLFSLQELKARFTLPAGITLHLGYKNGLLTAAGSVFGSAPVELPLQIPLAQTAKDAHDEMQLLVQLGRQIAERLVAKRAEDWLKAKLSP